MSKKTIYDNFRVVVYPQRLGDLGCVSVSDSLMCDSEEDRQRQYRDRAHEIKEQIRRHVDNAGIVSVEFDTNEVCEHCGYRWTESGNYNGGCCDEDEKNNPLAIAA